MSTVTFDYCVADYPVGYMTRHLGLSHLGRQKLNEPYEGMDDTPISVAAIVLDPLGKKWRWLERPAWIKTGQRLQVSKHQDSPKDAVRRGHVLQVSGRL